MTDRASQKINTLLVLQWDLARGGVVSVGENLARHLQAQGHGVLFLHVGPSLLLKSGTNKLGFHSAELRLSFPYAFPRRIFSALAFPFLFPIVLAQLLWF